MKLQKPHILCVNPWIHDFAAYDVWAKPIGLLSIASILRLHGFSVSYMDCQDRFHPNAVTSQDPTARNGRGPYVKTTIPPPVGLASIQRKYSRYGILPEWFEKDLNALPKPDIVLVTCVMTYWYPGLFETIHAVRSIYPDVPIVLGGIYATLCRDHAVLNSGADYLLSGPGETQILDLVGDITGVRHSLKFDPGNLNAYPYPAFDLQRKIGYVPLLTSRGCPFSCAYCASNILQPRRMLREPDRVVEEIVFWQDTYGVTDFAFYDDALLVNAGKHAVPMFKRIIESGRSFKFHTPNAVHIREITPEIAELMFAAGVQTLRLGLETLEFEEREIDRKVKEEEFVQAVSCLLAAGFQKEQVGAYLLVGLPGQNTASVELSIKTVKRSGITPILAYYTPIPHTKMWAAAVAASRYDLAADPIFTNNAIMPCRQSGFEWDELARLKQLVKEVIR
ncbi:MAG: B12-binding domain-containing radical SAM protein [Desulfobacteraceae bacterium]|nr:B12-binding domain-containing radical SAM protein [Desulfobacteraceae bacterium]MBC2757171.1 B12-binding domain-containing radical SAM protein [Desulfobacteraceae bacterium]